jgi:hypothetical protein
MIPGRYYVVVDYGYDGYTIQPNGHDGIDGLDTEEQAVEYTKDFAQDSIGEAFFIVHYVGEMIQKTVKVFSLEK